MVPLTSKVYLGLVQDSVGITMSVKNFCNINSTIKSGTGLSEHWNQTEEMYLYNYIYCPSLETYRFMDNTDNMVTPTI